MHGFEHFHQNGWAPSKLIITCKTVTQKRHKKQKNKIQKNQTNNKSDRNMHD